MSATQTKLSEQFIDVMGPMIGDAKAVDCVPQYSLQEINQRLDQSEEAFAAGQGIPETIARQNRHNFVNKLIAQ